VIWWLTFNGMNFVPAIGGAIVGLVLVLISAFKPQYSPYLAPGYALFEGLFIGGISAILKPCILNCNSSRGSNFCHFMVCLGLYKYKVVKVTEQFKSVVVAATLATTYYIISWLFSMFTSFVPVHYGNSMMSIE
jgi:uncharacterized YccA/Bax inhibitor family protein